MIARGRRIHADAGDLARHPRLQPRPHERARRRHRRHAFAQSAGGRRLQVQPAERRPGGHAITGWIEDRANALLEARLDRRAAHAVRAGARRVDDARARLPRAYVGDLGNVIDFDAIRGAGIRIGVDPLGGAGVHYWARDRRRSYGIDLDGRQRRRSIRRSAS